MKYTRQSNGWYTLETEHGIFEAGTKEAVRLAALVAENDAKSRREYADRQREIARESQAKELAFTDARYGA